MVVRVFSVPLTTRLADRYNVLRGAIIIASVGSAIGNFAIGLSASFVVIASVMVAAAVFFTPTYPLADAYALRGLTDRGKAYGPVRLWSSAAYIAANLASGIFIALLTKASIIWIITAAFLVGVGLAWALIPIGVHAPEDTGKMPVKQKSLWRMPAFVAVVIACGAIQSSHALYYGFSTLAWNAKGLSDVTIGGLWAIGVIAEIGLFALSGFLSRFISPVSLVMLGGIGGLLRWTAMAFDPPFVVLPALQLLHALTFGATHVGAMSFWRRLRRAAKARPLRAICPPRRDSSSAGR